MAFTGNGHELEQDTLINRFNRLEKLVHNNLYIKCPVCNGFPQMVGHVAGVVMVKNIYE